MEDATEDAPPHPAPPPVVSVAPLLSAARRRLYATFSLGSRPVPSEKPPPVAWMSLRGLLVNAEEASSARIVGLTGGQAVAWELFTPVQRFLLVAVIGVAAAESRKNKQIWNLQKSVELRDQVLSNMQQKLDDLCEQFSSTKEQHSSAAFSKLSTKDGELGSDKTFGAQKIKFVDCGCWHCEEHYGLFNELMGASIRRASCGNEVLQFKTPFSNEEQEERRMSDLSDWASSSVTSAADIQLNSLAVEQDIYNLKRECEEKDATIKELTIHLHSSEVANYKRVDELEDIIRRKNSIILKLKKDLAILEQKVVQLTRQRRPSISSSDSNGSSPLPQMRDNLIYDMDSTTSPSSSDSDSAPAKFAKDTPIGAIVLKKGSISPMDQKSAPPKAFSSSEKIFDRRGSGSRSVSPLREVSSNRKSNAASSSSQKQLSARGDLKKSRRRSLSGVTKSASSHKRWV